MKFNAPDHFSHSFELKLDTLPTKKSDRIALSILYPGLFFGAILVLLGVYELFNGFKHGSSAFDDISPDATVAFEPLISPWLFDSVIIVIGLGIIFSLILSYIRYKKSFSTAKPSRWFTVRLSATKKVSKTNWKIMKASVSESNFSNSVF